jgi:hypothetical protein
VLVKQARREHRPAGLENLTGGQNGGVFIKKGVGGGQIVKSQGKTGQGEEKNSYRV